MIGKTLSLNTANIQTSSKTNKQKQYFFATKTNFFQLRKIFTSEYIKHASGTQSKHAFFAFSLLPKHTNQRERIREIFKKIGRAWLHPFPLFLFLLSLSPCNGKHYLHTIYIPIYVSFICVSFVT